MIGNSVVLNLFPDIPCVKQQWSRVSAVVCSQVVKQGRESTKAILLFYGDYKIMMNSI